MGERGKEEGRISLDRNGGWEYEGGNIRLDGGQILVVNRDVVNKFC